MAYLLDSNVFISAKNNHYGFEFCPAFWDWLDTANAAGTVHSVERVYDELIERGDDLSDWARARRLFFLALTADDIGAVAEVNRWANDSADYDPAAKAEFADAADSFLVAQAHAGGHTVVTHERISDGRKRIKIPNAATARGALVHSVPHAARRAGPVRSRRRCMMPVSNSNQLVQRLSGQSSLSRVRREEGRCQAACRMGVRGPFR
jgi:hypothetical protein